RFIGRIRIMLCFETKRRPFRIVLAILALDGAVEKISRIKLDAGLGREHFHYTAGSRLVYRGGEGQSFSGLVQYKVMVISASEFELFVGAVDTCADRCRLCKIKRGSFNIAQFAGRDRAAVSRRKSARIQS